METWTVWNFATYGVLVIAAFGIAVDGAIRRFPALSEKAHKHWAGLLLSFGPLVLVSIATVLFLIRPDSGVRLDPQQGDSNSLRSRNTQLDADLAELSTALQLEKEGRDQIVVGFLGGETWQTVSRLLNELGQTFEDVDPRTYPGLRYERKLNRGLDTIFLYSRTDLPGVFRTS
jgi:hypothetical protein